MTNMKTNGERLVSLEVQLTGVQSDVGEVKSDIKEIKVALESNFVTHIEFANYKASQVIQKILLSIVNLIFGSLLGFFISQLIRG